jgi:predicted nicotinamide N-methyase
MELHNVHNVSFILELGAGCGVAGIAAAKLGCPNVILTDIPDVIPLLQSNINTNIQDNNLQVENNKQQAIGVVPCICDWTKPLSTELISLLDKGCLVERIKPSTINDCDDKSTDTVYNGTTNTQDDTHRVLLLVSDCIWMEELVEPLLLRIQSITSYIQSTVLATGRRYCKSIVTLLIVYQRRGKNTDDTFWSLLQYYLTSNENCTVAIQNNLSTIFGIPNNDDNNNNNMSNKFFIISCTFTKQQQD